MTQHINKFQWNSAHYDMRNKCFMKYISRNSFLCCLKKCCITSDVVVFFANSNGRISTNYMKYTSLMFTELQIYCVQFIYETCFMQCVSQVCILPNATRSVSLYVWTCSKPAIANWLANGIANRLINNQLFISFKIFSKFDLIFSHNLNESF